MPSPLGEAVKEATNEEAEEATKEAVHSNEEAEVVVVVVVNREDEEDLLEPAITLDTWDEPETLVGDQALPKTRTCGFIWFSF